MLFGKRMPYLQTHKLSWNEQTFGKWVPTRPETKNDCAVEGQQQFTVVAMLYDI
jgi:hypothetical protein